MPSNIQQAEQNWHEALYATHKQRDFIVPFAIRNRYLFPTRNPLFYLELLFKLLGDVKDKRVLVFGCGDDTTTVLLALKGAEVWAFDLSEQAMRVQQKMALANNVHNKIHPLVCAAEEFPFSENSFDIIVGSAILHHIPDHLAELPSQLFRSLGKGGRAFFAEPVILSRTLGRFLAWLPGHQDISPGERQLTSEDLHHFAKHFRMTPHLFCFLARLDRFILKGPLEIAPAWQRLLIHAIHWADSIILRFPLLNRLAGVTVLELSPLKQ